MTIEGAISTVADKAYEEYRNQEGAAQAALQNVLDALALPAPAALLDKAKADDTSVPADIAVPASLEHWPEGSPERRLIDKLASEEVRVLVVSSERGEEGRQVRVAHEALFTSWPAAKEALGVNRNKRAIAAKFLPRVPQAGCP